MTALPAATRVVDPTPCLIRHVRRPTAEDDAGRIVNVLGGGYYPAGGAELEAFNGRAGWQSGAIESTLSGDGNGSIVLPNTEGDDGVLHRERFALLTDPDYRIGEEWLEVYREPMSPDNLMAVITPAGWRIDRGRLELRGPDLTGLYTLARSSELDVWHHAPRDVFDFYSRLPVSELAEAFPWTTVPGSPGITRSLPAGVAGDAWSAAARMRWIAPSPPVSTETIELVVTAGAAIRFVFRPSNGDSYLDGAGIANPIAGAGVGRSRRTVPGGCSLKVLVRDGWAYGYVDGELVCRAQRAAATRLSAPTAVAVIATSATVELARLDVESSRPFGLRGADAGELKLPGAPTAGGLRGTYYAEQPKAALHGATQALLEAVLDPLDEPADSRLDATINMPTGTAWRPGGVAINGMSVRWTGAIYLDLSGNGRRVRIAATNGGVRVYIGRTMLGTAVIDQWTPTSKTDMRSPNLRDTLGEGSGWYPIVLEWCLMTSSTTLALEESALDVAGNPTGGWTVVSASKLSPLGCYLETHRHESHRELLGAIADGFGYQWRVEPRTLESGLFPGQIAPRARVGVDTDKIVTGTDATDLASEGDAMDAVDRVLVDAAGIADPKGSGQLTADVVNDLAAAAGHLFLSSAAESLPEITEVDLLEQRADSLLALRATPNEQIGVRPTSAAQEVTDTFPLSGMFARRRWKPGDGLRLALEDLSVIDVTPRQLVAVALPIYRQGVGAPTVGWRQRPRGLRSFLRRTARAAAAGRRNFQGQTGEIQGNLGVVPTTAANPDPYSRIALPALLDDVVAIDLVVETFSTTAGAGTLEVNSVNVSGSPISGPGRYSLMRYLGRADSGTGPRMFARITGTGITSSYRIVARIRLRS